MRRAAARSSWAKGKALPTSAHPWFARMLQEARPHARSYYLAHILTGRRPSARLEEESAGFGVALAIARNLASADRAPAKHARAKPKVRPW